MRSIEETPEKRPKSKTGNKPGRPQIDESLSETIIRIRKETGWGYTKIIQAMLRLGHTVSRQTVKNVLVEAGLGPQPQDHPDTCSDFLKRDADTLWQCDFACKRKWTLTGMVDLYFLVFIHVGTRRIWVSPCTANPNADWTTQQACNFQMRLQEEILPREIVQRDQDTKYGAPFDEVFRSTGCKIKKTCPRSPNLQAFVERVIQTLKHEVLNAFCVISERHLDHILHVAQDWYNHRRGHTERDHLPPVRDGGEPPAVDLAKHRLECYSELGGHLKSYRRAA
ncbi:integrase core domain-containing protein [Candidatus Laterigemmans baculatus]|uniref:integrase core domain-containing protein n=1 Tax=Candidatus Laterigemmans baculatus TaxID=2770505 RepID=UPI0013DC51E6|nr:integrase core domain-containing protein [Candidatus Laterigemmans baculatus]